MCDVTSSRGHPRWACSSDWESHRLTIQELYLDQNLSLREVIKTMRQTHGFQATYVLTRQLRPFRLINTSSNHPRGLFRERMYKTRLRHWGLDKNYRYSEVVQLLRLRKEREEAGKETVFTIRGREVDWGRIYNYVKRRGLDVATAIASPRPGYDADFYGDIGYRTPSPDPERTCPK
ncbi:hypothetical protein GQ53DRAFT_741258 [Thozetella sp. PMI_491]|nr:hypothetical protein GQ53DRAFT_741258 [Thozetella sp. PMI_491]